MSWSALSEERKLTQRGILIVSYRDQRVTGLGN